MTSKKPQIKFSHNYIKLPISEKEARLLGVVKWSIDFLPASFLDYDTEYFLEDSDVKNYYELPKGEVLILFFWAKQLFTTIRRWTPEKEKYYQSLVGQDFEVVINDEG